MIDVELWAGQPLESKAVFFFGFDFAAKDAYRLKAGIECFEKRTFNLPGSGARGFMRIAFN